VEEENKNLRNAVTSNQEKLTELKIGMANTCSLAADNDNELGKLKADIQQLRCRNIKLEAYTRRENIKIFDLPEIRDETPSDTEVLVKSIFEEKMNLERRCLSVSIVCQLDATKPILISLDLSSQNLVSTETNNLSGLQSNTRLPSAVLLATTVSPKDD